MTSITGESGAAPTGDSGAAAAIAHLVPLAEFRYQLRRFLSFSEASAERAGVAAQQYQLLQVIAAMPAGTSASITLLAERMILRHNSAVELVDRAERAELVRRESDESDLRRSIITLTPKGAKILDTMVAEHIAELHKLSPDIVNALNSVLNTTQKTVAESLPEASSH
jgi:DNA-binding MarR family transcriptional regulator